MKEGVRDNNCSLNANITVVVPSYNHEKFVRNCLLSIFNQTLQPSELIVIDDGSTDSSVSIIEQTLKEAPFRSTLIARENRGLCQTLNQGLELASGEFFAYLGSDDIWLPRFLETSVKMLRTDTKFALSFGSSFIIDEENRIIGYGSDRGVRVRPKAKDHLLYGSTIGSTTVVYRVDKLAKYRWNPEIKLEDYDMYLRLSSEYDFVYVPEVLSAWRLHGNNTSANSKLMLKELIDAIYRNAPILGLSPYEIDRAVRHKNIFAIDQLLEEGRQMEAVKLYFSNLRAFADKQQLLIQGVRVLTPAFVRKIRRRVFGSYSPFRVTQRIDENFEIVAI